MFNIFHIQILLMSILKSLFFHIRFVTRSIYLRTDFINSTHFTPINRRPDPYEIGKETPKFLKTESDKRFYSRHPKCRTTNQTLKGSLRSRSNKWLSEVGRIRQSVRPNWSFRYYWGDPCRRNSKGLRV